MSGFGPFQDVEVVNVCEFSGTVVVRIVDVTPEVTSVAVIGKKAETVQAYKSGKTLVIRGGPGSRSGKTEKIQVGQGMRPYKRPGGHPEVEVAVAARVVKIIDKK
jgi:hypothetical protein